MKGYMSRERKGAEFTKLCLRSVRDAIAANKARENPNTQYVAGLERLAEMYARGQGSR